MFLQLHINDKLLSEETDDNEDVEPIATASKSQDSDLDDGAPSTSANIEQRGDSSSSIVTPSPESLKSPYDSRVGMQSSTLRDSRDLIDFFEVFMNSVWGLCVCGAGKCFVPPKNERLE
ncbi:hypothetical protein KIN20_020261 [Parelaphostrongylus tenuis]|uniref:Uncharacterized protein n=1 Tax=Parelaphostrongylus tenuis TaxID=148309 RepID=A0AAD5N6A8_PARTN|nr:hypothetical protein KIN20_020261 [Parelaphostrongylus tenuis]